MTLFFSCLCVLVLESMGDAVLGLPCQELLLKASAHRWSHSGLHQYVLAIATFLNHPFNAIHLTLDTPNPIQIRCMARVLPHRCTPRSMVIYLGQHRHRLVDYLNDGRIHVPNKKFCAESVVSVWTMLCLQRTLLCRWGLLLLIFWLKTFRLRLRCTNDRL